MKARGDSEGQYEKNGMNSFHQKQSDETRYLRTPVDSILDDVLTVSPNRQYLGITVPTTPATTGPATRSK